MISIESVRDALRNMSQEMCGLTLERPDSADLEEKLQQSQPSSVCVGRYSGDSLK
jgi:hypothetical protein